MSLNLFGKLKLSLGRTLPILGLMLGFGVVGGADAAITLNVNSADSAANTYKTVGRYGIKIARTAVDTFQNGVYTVTLGTYSGNPGDSITGLSLVTTRGGSGTAKTVNITKAAGVTSDSVWVLNTNSAMALINAPLKLTIAGKGVSAASGGGDSTVSVAVQLLYTLNKRAFTKTDFKITNPGGSSKTLVYDGTRRQFVIEYASGIDNGGGTITPTHWKVGSTDSLGRIDTVGAYYVKADISGGKNYKDSVGFVIGDTLKITKANPTITWPVFNEIKYDPSKQTLNDYNTFVSTDDHISSPGVVEGYVDSVLSGGTFAWTAPPTRIVAVGSGVSGATYNMKWTPPNTLAGRQYKAAWAIASLPNDGSAPVADNWKSTNPVTFKIVKRTLEPDSVLAYIGTNPVGFDSTDADPPRWDGKAYVKVYNGVAPSIRFTWVNGAVAQGAKPVTATGSDSLGFQVGYVGTKLVGGTVGTELNPATTAPSEAGTYKVYVRVDKNTGNYAQTWERADSMQLVILPREIKVDKVTHSKVYDASTVVTDPKSIVITFGNKGSTSSNDNKIIGTTNITAKVNEAYYAEDTAGTRELHIFDAELSGTGHQNYKLLLDSVYTNSAPDAPVDVGTPFVLRFVEKGTTAAPGGIRAKPITIAASGHALGEKVYDGDSLYTAIPADASTGVEGTVIAFDGLEGDDAFEYGTDYELTDPRFRGKNVGEGKPLVSGRLTLKKTASSVHTTAWNYKFAAAGDSLLAGKGIAGEIVPKSLAAVAVSATGTATPVAQVTFKLGSKIVSDGKPYTGAPIVLKDTVGNVSSAELVVYDIPGYLNKKNNSKSIITKSDYYLEYENNTAVSDEATVTLRAVDGGNYKDPDEEAPDLTKTFSIKKKKLTLKTSGHVVADRFYVEGDKSAPIVSLAFDGLVPGEELKLATEDEPGDYTIDNAIYGSPDASANAKAVTGGTVTLSSESEVAVNYEIPSTISISAATKVSGFVNKMPLTISNVTTGESRVYNGRDTVNVTNVSFATIADPESEINIGSRNGATGYTVVGAKYADANVGEGKAIAEGTIALKGTANTTNYVIPDPSIAGFGNGDAITPRSLRINSARVTKPYDGSAYIGTENVTITFASASGEAGLVATDKDKEGYSVEGAAFADELIKASGKDIVSGTVELTDYLALNYILENPELTAFKGSITKGVIPISGVAHTKVYDGNVSATDVAFSIDASYHPLFQGDVKELLNPITWSYTSKAAGTKTLKPASVSFRTTGANAAPKELTDYYTVSADAVEVDEGGITKKSLPIVSVTHSKPYDGTTTAKITNITFAGAAQGGLVTGDAATSVRVDSTDADYTSPSVGTTTVVLHSVYLGGTNGANYEVVIPDSVITVGGTVAGIQGANLTIAKVEVSKVYDGTTTVASEDVKVLFNGVAATDTPFVDYYVEGVTLADKNAGATKTISGGKVGLIGSALDNYIFTATTGDLKGKGFTTAVTQKKLRVTGATHTKNYDGNATARGVKVTFDESEVLDADVGLVVDSVQAQYTSAMLGTKTLKINRVFYKGGNYASDTLTLTLAEGGITGTYVDSISVRAAGNADSVSGRRTLQFSATVYPANASIKTVAWSVSNPDLASISTGGLLTTKGNGTVVVTATATDSSGKKGTYNIKIGGVGVAEVEREIPTAAVTEVVTVAPVKVVASGFTAGPSPVSLGGTVKFFSGKQVKSGSLYIFDAQGNAVAKLSAKSGTGEIGSWNLKNKGVSVSEGTYVVKGALVGKDGTREKVSFVFAVVK